MNTDIENVEDLWREFEEHGPSQKESWKTLQRSFYYRRVKMINVMDEMITILKMGLNQ